MIKKIRELIGQIPAFRPEGSVRIVLACGLVAALAAGTWGVLFPGSWSASQSLVVRDDLLGDSLKPGRFNSPESMKSAQETIFHIARKREVIESASVSAGLANGKLDARDIEDYQGLISIVSPNGGELGKTEVFVLKVRQKSAEQARKFVIALSAEIERQLRVVRTSLLHSMQAELALNLDRSTIQYGELAASIQQLEEQVGQDLQSLRSMVDPNSSVSDLQRTLEQLRSEIRAAQNERERVSKQVELVELVMREPENSNLTTSNELLELQPVLKRMNEGLVDTRMSLSRALGSYDEGHPAVSVARAAVEQTIEQIRQELRSTGQGLHSQRELHEQKIARLSAVEKQYLDRLVEVGKRRVPYKTLNDELSKRGEALAKMRTELATIQSLAESAGEVSLITHVGEPFVATRPDGMSRRAMLLLGFAGGSLFGIGLLVLKNGPRTFLGGAAEMLAQQADRALASGAGAAAAAVSRMSALRSPQLAPAGAVADAASSPEANRVEGRVQSLVPDRSRSSQSRNPGSPAAAPSAMPAVEPKPQAKSPPRPAAAPSAVPLSGKSDAHPATSSPPIQPGMMVPNLTGRPGQVLKTSDLIRTPADRPAQVEIRPSGESPSTPPLQPVRPVTPAAPQVSSRPPVPARPETAKEPRPPAQPQGFPMPAAPSVEPEAVAPALPEVRDSHREPDGGTISLADLQLETIRKQLLELDPTISFDVFCESVKKS